MKILLMRHAESAPGFPDELRVLTDYGISSLASRPDDLASLLESVTDIFVSPYQRTQQTINNFLPGCDYQTVDWLMPDQDPEWVLSHLLDMADDSVILLVTHMPMVGEIASLLIEGGNSLGYRFIPAQIMAIEADLPVAGLGNLLKTYTLAP
ncbi:MAG: phosphohistidine phosphatase SixA [Pseudomonadota bacterium]